MPTDYAAFFARATGYVPYGHQMEFAARPFEDCVLVRPTGCGKTAEVVVKWLWQVSAHRHNAPTRLVYCLPTRALVNQTSHCIEAWISKLDLHIPVHVLRGGEVDGGWDLDPERPGVIVGTQDLLISRALNRGYAMSRYRWPVDFGLLNSDALWILDEVQLMGSGLLTACQLAAFRRKFGTIGPAWTIWMSATLDERLMATPDLSLDSIYVNRLGRIADKELGRRTSARKLLDRAAVECRMPEGLAAFATREHRQGQQTLIIVNRVERAVETYAALEKTYRGQQAAPELLLLHSRFRPGDRAAREEVLAAAPPPQGRIVVATQVVEAGMDIDSELMVTDLAPYASMVQRFGRSNRAGQLEESRIYWVDRPLTSRQKKLAELKELEGKQAAETASPYSPEAVEQAGSLLNGLHSGAIADLPQFEGEAGNDHVLRRRDLLDLFDTSRDLSGFDVDISRFVRGGEDHELFVAWGRIDRDGRGPARRKQPGAEELCPIPLSQLRDFVRKKGKPQPVWSWDALAGDWEIIRPGEIESRLRPGAVFVIDCGAGGYDKRAGWSPGSNDSVPEVEGKPGEHVDDSMDSDECALANYQQTLDAHTREVRDELQAILDCLDHPELKKYIPDLTGAALLHDIGKTHSVFREAVSDNGGPMLAKAREGRRYKRPHFRHELASALAVLAMGGSDLTAYLVAAHHGKVRLSIRSLPGEVAPERAGAQFARGVHEGDELPEVVLDGVKMPRLVLNLGLMSLGSADGRSWADRMIALRDQLGPFRLAYLEALLRAADWRASKSPKEVLR